MIATLFVSEAIVEELNLVVIGQTGDGLVVEVEWKGAAQS